MVFVGYGIVAPERNWNDYAGHRCTDKTVVILVNDPGYATQDPACIQWQCNDLLRPLDLQI